MNNKGALELSINAIVIIVLAMTLLGLGLTFIRGQISKITETSTAVSDAIKDQILEDLRTGDKPLSFPTPEIQMNRGKTEIISIGVRNMGDIALVYHVEIRDLSVDESGNSWGCLDDARNYYSPGTKSQSRCAAFFWDNGLQTLQAGKDQVIGIKLFPPSTFDTYLYKLELKTEDPVTGDMIDYATKTFFVQVV